MRQDIELCNVTAGELSPRMKGRTDFDKYFNGCDTLLNMVVMPQGGATRRPGTRFIALNAVQTAAPLLVPFQFNTLQAYILEFTHLKVRVYANDGVVVSGMTPVDVVTPYASADLSQLQFAQSNDTLFIFHPGYPPATLTRSSNTAWTYSATSFLDGPYLPENTTTTTITPSGTSGSITLTASSTTGINNDTGFQTSDVGRLVRIKMYSLWAWCIITARSSTTVVTATVKAKVKDGASGALDGAAWAASTDYVIGQVVKGTDGTNLYQALTPGRSATGTVGPQGQGSKILDGTVVWTCLAARDAGDWVDSTFYGINDVIFVNGHYWQAINTGKTSSDPDNAPHDPADAMGGIWTADSSMLWAYLAPFTFPATTLNWRLGAWGGAQGYPAVGRFWQQRLTMAGHSGNPSQINTSQSADFTNMSPTRYDGLVLDNSALQWTIDDDQVNAVQWLIGAGSAQAMQLGVGTFAAEHVLQAATTSAALTPTSVQSYPETSYGTAPRTNPLRIGKSVLFVDKTGRKLREWRFYWQNNGYEAPDKLQFSEHIGRARDGSDPALNGLGRMAYQQAPHQIVWIIRNDGTLIGVTYDANENVFAPHRHELGGNYYGGPPVVESLAVIPAPDNTYDELWLAVLRTINGTVTRTIEVMSRYFDGQPQDQSFFADCALSSALTMPNAKLTVSGLAMNSKLVESVSYGGTGTAATDADVFSSGDVNTKLLRVNGGLAVVTAYQSARSVSIETITSLFSLAPASSGNWSFTALQTSFSGLGHLTGETVTVCGDGAAMGTATVAAGAVTVPRGGSASFATIGLAYRYTMITMPWEPMRAAAASSQGKVKRIDTIWARVHETLGFDYFRRFTDPMTGAVEEKLMPFETRRSGQHTDFAPPLYSGVFELKPQGGRDREGQIGFTGDDPTPFTLLAVFARGDVGQMPGPG